MIPEHLDPYHFDEWQVAFDATIEIECNWKTSVDAFNEAYHLSATHTWTLEFSDDVNTLYDCYDRHTRMIFPEVQASPRHPGAGTVTPGIRDLFLRASASTWRTSGRPGRGARARSPTRSASMGPALGCDFSELNEAADVRRLPLHACSRTLTFNIHSLFVWVFTHRPHPDDPNKMFFDFWSLVRAPAQQIPRPEKLLLPHRGRRHARGQCEGGDLLDEDLYNLPRIQAGMRSARVPEPAPRRRRRSASATSTTRSRATRGARTVSARRRRSTCGPRARRRRARVSSCAGRELLVCNAEGRFYAIENRCPHAMRARSTRPRSRGCVLECPLHGGRLDVRDGSPQRHPIRRPRRHLRGARAAPGGIEIDARVRAAEPEETRMHDLVIRGGTLVDGTRRRAARGRRRDRRRRASRAVGARLGRGARELDARGKLVTPGFVDIHTHYDGQATWDPLLTPSCWHGVTTVVMGNCGVGFAPVRPGERAVPDRR